ncbi:hypothetical protein VTG60DRAFT_1596 [Thermothelomyces hinnuleus]
MGLLEWKGAVAQIPRMHVGAVVVGLVVVLLFARWFPTWWRLRHIPGPFWASITDIPKILWVKTVYPMRPGFPKGDFYASLRPYTKTKGSLQAVFNTQNEEVHKALKTPIAPLFSVTNASVFEPHIDDLLRFTEEQLDKRYAKNGEVFDLGDWCQYFAFDVMGTMTFSKRYGFLDQAKDVNSMIGSIHNFMRTVAPMTQAFWLDKILYKNWVADWLRPAPGLGILKFVASVIEERRQDLAKGKEGTVTRKDSSEGPKDFLTRFVQIKDSNPEVPPWAVTAWTFSNVTAGSDSVGTVARTTLYHLLANPETLRKLHGELLAANLSLPYPQYNEVRDLPYLDACVLEGSRMHPPFALPFERVVPEGGIELFGYWLPPGTNIGGNPYVVNRDKAMFGDDAEKWRPERWIERGEEHKKKLERSNLTFGAGRRICLGRHIGILEIKKFISFLVLNYEMEIVDPNLFRVENIWFFKQTGLYAKIRKREQLKA